MSGIDLSEIPAPLKGIQHYLKIAAEHDKRDPVVSYWARLYALQTGLKLSTKTTAENNFLLKLMDWLENTKKSLIDNEAITNDVAAQAHLENWALKLFLYADKNDREGNFGKSVIQSFYTAGLLYDVLTTFGELSEEASQNRKYAKWKAAYIHNCLKNGETPIPGPMKEEGDDFSNMDNTPPDEDLLGDTATETEPAGSAETNEEEEENQADEVVRSEPEGDSGTPEPASTAQPTPPPNTDAFGFPSVPTGTNPNIGNNSPQIPGNTSYPSLPTPVTPNPYNPAPTPTSPSNSRDFSSTPANSGNVTLTAEQTNKVQKYIKWAGSAINYDDAPTAIENLQKALHLLTTGEDS